MIRDIHQSLAISTQQQYEKYFRTFEQFILAHFTVHPLKVSSFEIQHFITYLARYKHSCISTIRCYMSAISYYIKLNTDLDPTKSYAITRLLKTYGGLCQYSKFNNRKPIGKSILRKLQAVIQQSNISNYYKLCYANIYNLMYHAALRVSEIGISSTARHILQCESVEKIKIDNKHVIRITFKSYKHSKNNSSIIAIYCDKKMIQLFNDFKKIRGSHKGPLFCHTDQTPFTRGEIAKLLKSHLQILNYDISMYNTHSFRIGLATDMCNSGFSELQIKQVGRWNSDAYKKYLRPQTIYSNLGHTQSIRH